MQMILLSEYQAKPND